LKALIKIKKESRLQCIDIHGDAFIYYLIIFFSREVHEAVTVPTLGLILDITPEINLYLESKGIEPFSQTQIF